MSLEDTLIYSLHRPSETTVVKKLTLEGNSVDQMTAEATAAKRMAFGGLRC